MSDYDLLVNMLNEPSDEELGKAVKKLLWKKKPKEFDLNGKKYTGSYREIIVGGS